MSKWHTCPNCGDKLLTYDSFEDVYHCILCHTAHMPNEVGLPDNPNSGLRKISRKIAKCEL